MTILFVASGGEKEQPSPIIGNQANSIVGNTIDIKFFIIKGKGLKSYLKSVFSLRKELKKNKIDIIHAHYGLCGIVALLARRKEKLLVSFMGDDLLGSNKHKGEVLILSKIAAWLNIILSSLLYNHSIVKSPDMLQKFKINRRVTLIPNGVDLERFKEIGKEESLRKTGFNPQKKHLIFVSKPDRVEKNFTLANNSYKLLDNSQIELHIVSEVSNEKLPYYYNSADLLVMTSFHEGSSNAIKEAMACNCPIVSTDVGDVKWVLGNTDGCYIADYNPDDFANKILKALAFTSEKERTRGRNRIIELGLDSKSIAKRIIAVYQRIIEENE